jgi:hypothetical protein
LLDASARADVTGAYDLLVTAVLANTRGYVSQAGAVDDGRVQMLERALEVVAQRAPDRARLLAVLASELSYGTDTDRARQLANEANTLAGSLGDPELVAHTVVAGGFPRRVPQEVRALLDDSLRVEVAVVDPTERFWLAVQIVTVAAELADFQLARHHVDQLPELAARSGQPIVRWFQQCVTGTIACIDGRLDDAEVIAGAALDLGLATGQADAFMYYGSELMSVRWAQGRYGEIVDLVTDAVEQNPGIPTFIAAHATALAEAGRLDEAARLLDTALLDGFALPDDNIWLTGMCNWANAATLCAHREAAGALVAILRPWADHVAFTGVSCTASIAHWLGALSIVGERYDDAARHLDRAAAVHAALGAPFFIALTELERTRLAIAVGAAEAPDHLAQVEVLSRKHGFGAIEARARDLAASCVRSVHDP